MLDVSGGKREEKRNVKTGQQEGFQRKAEKMKERGSETGRVEKVEREKQADARRLSEIYILFCPRSRLLHGSAAVSDSHTHADTHLMRYSAADSYKQPIWIEAIKPEEPFDPALNQSGACVNHQDGEEGTLYIFLPLHSPPALTLT